MVSRLRIPSDKEAAGGNQPGAPADLAYLNDAVQRSRGLLDLEDDWDGDGAVSIKEPTWRRMQEYLLGNATGFWEVTGTSIPAPKIGPAQEGSIDLLWEVGDRMLLLNIPEDSKEPASFYGEEGALDSIKGNLDTTGQSHWLLMWLTK
jgi:hypothetical protein